MSDIYSVKEIVEDGLGSIGKIKILRALSEEKKLVTVYFLHKKTHLKREDIKRNLADLIKIEWVIEQKIGNNVYTINRQNKYVQKIVLFFYEIGYITNL
jgi:DNA-binding transcriptional ArsR family regulator